MKKNNFDLVRILLALIVVMAHISDLTKLEQFAILGKIFNSDFAVKGFFAISGFLVTKSYVNSKNKFEYAEKRFRRIYPAYAASITFCIFIGLISTSYSATEFLISREFIRYLFANLTFMNFVQPNLPGVFNENPVQAMNGALWTIKIEVMLYLCVPVICYMYEKFGQIQTFILVLLFSISWVYFFHYIYTGPKSDEIARQFPGQLSYFLIGSIFSVNKILLSKIGILTILSAFLFIINKNYVFVIIFEPIFYSCITIWLSTSAFININIAKFGDISYGIYLFHFPIIQFFIYIGVFNYNIWLGLSGVVCASVILSLISWHLIEKRFLKRSSHYVAAAM